MVTIPAPILSAEDESTDRLILQIAYRGTGLPHSLVFVQDGVEAVDYLAGKPPYSDRLANPLPGLLMLDLKMPRMDGFDVLAWLTGQPELRDLPVVVLSSSSNDADVERARNLGARDYLVKPHDFRDLTRMLRELVDRWLPHVRPGA
jgi:CheY-like chemotaxis protein